jgi:hypothetical protein
MAEIDRILHFRGLKQNCPVLLNGQIGIIEDQGQETLVFGTVAGNKYVPSNFDFENFKQDILNIIGDTNNLTTINKIIVNAINELNAKGGSGGSGGGNVNYTIWTYSATADNTSEFDIVNNGIYDPTKDSIQMFFKGSLLEPNDKYTLSDLHVTLNGWTLNNGESIFMYIFKVEEMSGESLIDGTVQKQKLEASVQTTLTNADKIGDLSTLGTTAKDTIVNSINENTTSLADNTQQHTFIDVFKLKFVYGAKHDGDTDDSQALQNYIDDLQTSGYGGTIYFPSGKTLIKNIDLLYIAKPIELENIKFIGCEGAILMPSDGANYMFTIAGDDTTNDLTHMIRNISFENIKIKAGLSDTTTIDIPAILVNNVRFLSMTNVEITGFLQGGLELKQTFDSIFNNVRILSCGSVNSGTTYSALSLKMGVYDVTNACRFINCHFENSPQLLYIGDRSRHNYFDNCKFEQGVNGTTKNCIFLEGVLEIGFSNCQFVNNINSGVAFLRNIISIYTTVTETSININNCNFACPDSIYAIWLDVTNTKINNCSFSETSGQLSYGNPFNFNNRCIFADSTISFNTNESKLFNITGSDNNIHDITVNMKQDDSTTAVLRIPANTSRRNNINNIRLNYSYGTSMYAISGFTNNNLIDNTIDFKSKPTITNTATNILYGCNTILLNPLTDLSISNISYGHEGKEITLMNISTFNTTLVNSTLIATKSGSNTIMTKNIPYRFKMVNSVWYEL